MEPRRRDRGAAPSRRETVVGFLISGHFSLGEILTHSTVAFIPAGIGLATAEGFPMIGRHADGFTLDLTTFVHLSIGFLSDSHA